MSFYQRLERFRYPGESNRDFSQRIGCKHPQISLWKRADEADPHGIGSASRPNPRTLGVIANALGVDPHWLLWGDE